jgi:multidrug efflux pump subunit AcrA (membrane-fusion protein)
VNQVSVKAGDEVNPGDTLVQIADFAHMQVSFRVDEYDIGDVTVGENCRVTATASEKTFESTVDTINYISSSTGNVAYYTATANILADGGVYPGMQVTVTVPQEEAADRLLELIESAGSQGRAQL